jgi:hypothetical protein
MLVDDLLLPLGEGDLPLVLAPGGVLGEELGPALPAGVQHNAARACPFSPRHPSVRHVLRDGRCGFVDDRRVGGDENDPELPGAGGAVQAAVTEVEAEEVGVGLALALFDHRRIFAPGADVTGEHPRAGDRGIEPRVMVLETIVLPLHQSPSEPSL